MASQLASARMFLRTTRGTYQLQLRTLSRSARAPWKIGRRGHEQVMSLASTGKLDVVGLWPGASRDAGTGVVETEDRVFGPWSPKMRPTELHRWCFLKQVPLEVVQVSLGASVLGDPPKGWVFLLVSLYANPKKAYQLKQRQGTHSCWFSPSLVLLHLCPDCPEATSGYF